MPYSDGLKQLATVVELLEAAGTDVVDARPCETAGEQGDGRFRVELRLDLPLESELSLPAEPNDRPATPAPAPAEAGRSADDPDPADRTDDPPAIESAPEAEDAPGENGPRDGSGDLDADADGDRSTDADDTGGNGDGEERVPCRAPECDRTFAGEHGMKIHFSKTHVDEGADGPAYRDPDRLREAYAATDGFAAMREYLDVDVSTETIRRYAVEYGIHGCGADGTSTSVPEPPTIDRATLAPAVEPIPADAAPASPLAPPTVDAAALEPAIEAASGDAPAAPDAPADRAAPELDEALPAGLTVPELKSTVRNADTLYQVAAELDLEREQARALLRNLDLLDLVHGRVATKRRRDELKSEIDRRLQKNVESALSS